MEDNNQSLQSNNFLSRFATLSLRSFIVKCSKKYALGKQAIILITCLPCRFVAPSRVKQINGCLPRATRTSFIVLTYSFLSRLPCDKVSGKSFAGLERNLSMLDVQMRYTAWPFDESHEQTKLSVSLFLLA